MCAAPSERNNSRAFCSSTAVSAVGLAGILLAGEAPNSPGETPGGPTGSPRDESVPTADNMPVLRNANSSCLSNGIRALSRVQAIYNFPHRVSSRFDFVGLCPFTELQLNFLTPAR